MYGKSGLPLRTLRTCQIYWQIMPSRNWRRICQSFVEGIEARETEGQETEIEEKGQPSMNPMDVPPAIEAAKLSSKIEELTNNLGLDIDFGHLFK